MRPPNKITNFQHLFLFAWLLFSYSIGWLENPETAGPGLMIVYYSISLYWPTDDFFGRWLNRKVP